MKIAIGSDHRGVELKSKLNKFLTSKKIEVKDFGTKGKKSCDYPDFGFKVAEEVAKGNFDFGLLICNTGLGMSITANKVKGVRAALCINEKLAEYARRHNDANILVLSAEFVNEELGKKIIETWLKANFEGNRHKRRVDKITSYESKFVEREPWELELKRLKQEARKWQSRAWRR
ncbi:ribose 5-phosphate isomerase B [candidate division WOR-3 bacterium]|nr:ribose 5-phosphate isomerase B [candidate division WOR-3 bacterium]